MNILITGGASGLGKAITKKLAEDKNNHVYFTYAYSLTNANEINYEWNNTTAIKCDFTKDNELEMFIDKIKQIDIDVIINNAYQGNFRESYFHKNSSENYLKDFTNNIIPTIKINQAIISKFRKKKAGKIITILTSGLINQPPIGSSIYMANKAYLAHLTKVWATENTTFNIQSNSISPSIMETNMTKDTDSREIEIIKQTHPLKRLLDTTEVAETALFLINASPHINGIDIPLNAATNIK